MLAFIPELLQPTQVVIDGHVVAQAYWQIVYYIAVMIASYFLNQALTKKVRNKTEAATADSWQFPQTDEGTPQCIFSVTAGRKTGRFWRMVIIVIRRLKNEANSNRDIYHYGRYSCCRWLRTRSTDVV